MLRIIIGYARIMILILVVVVLLLDVHAVYNRDVVCILDKSNPIACELVKLPNRRNFNIPSVQPNVSAIKGSVYYNCSTTLCDPIQISSITQITPPESNLKVCYIQNKKYTCQTLNYYKYRDIDKLAFLSNTMPDKEYYLIDCLAYTDGGRVCHKKDKVDSYTKLVDTGNIARPHEPNILSQEEFICEQTPTTIYCDLNKYLPSYNGLKLKKMAKIDKKILLKTGKSMFLLSYRCIQNWCGYSGALKLKRINRRYYHNNNRVYRCYFANKQQVCKPIWDTHKNVYNARDWLSS